MGAWCASYPRAPGLAAPRRRSSLRIICFGKGITRLVVKPIGNAYNLTSGVKLIKVYISQSLL